MLDEVGVDIERLNWEALRDELVQGGAKILTQARIDAITDDGVIIIDKEQHSTLLKADTVVLALGVTPVNALAIELANKVKELYIIGDAKVGPDLFSLDIASIDTEENL